MILIIVSSIKGAMLLHRLPSNMRHGLCPNDSRLASLYLPDLFETKCVCLRLSAHRLPQVKLLDHLLQRSKRDVRLLTQSSKSSTADEGFSVVNVVTARSANEPCHSPLQQGNRGTSAAAPFTS